MHVNTSVLRLFLLSIQIICTSGSTLPFGSTWPPYGSYTPYGDPETPSDSGEDNADLGPPPPDRLPLNIITANQFIDCLNNTGIYYNLTVESDGTTLVVPAEPAREIVMSTDLLRCISQATGGICVGFGPSIDHQQGRQDSVPSYQIDGQGLADRGALGYNPRYWQEQQFRNGPGFDDQVDIAASLQGAQARAGIHR
ncbi:hypothetical protein MVLG_04381 [Microbotryum lychnidis-dioicae p1A1 Lamole]|uniref:Uncharacterized protein n=1 Tax=Microbotryum lychnidis-dioicae (strain p1A1 Lamole / MvSl-1064) TaxID=683840 RepID=U5HB19_USTV1|nr:hypothetical protein MVLG_04381 [Microbotryum lychnidis-dioicae p1A1 Lamole]|eukprot:KDE05246.1 hypothetical protein MVLG_04381 [Microbotryum lychnidis-dioicae p1A1 Lamole]